MQQHPQVVEAGVEDRVDAAHHLVGVAGHREDDLEVRRLVAAAVRVALGPHPGHQVGEVGVVVAVDLLAALHHVRAAEVPRPRGVLGDQDAAGLAEAVAELHVLAEAHRGVPAAGRVEQVAGQREGRADEGAEGARAGLGEVVGTPPHALDPLVRLGLVPVPERGDLAGGDLVAGGRRVLGEQPLGVDEALGARDHGVVDLVQPAQLGLEVVGPQQHVGVDEVEELALARPARDLAGAGAAPALLDADDAGVVGHHRGQLHRRGAAVVGDHHLHEVRRVGLRGQAGEHVRQGAVRSCRPGRRP